MRLSKLAIMAIKGSKEIKQRLIEELQVSDKTLYRWIADNDDSLTKAAAIKVIRDETGLEDSQLLEETANHAA